jgi:hypothetical protein
VDKDLRRRTISAASVARDLEFLAVFERLITLMEDGSDDFVLKQALFRQPWLLMSARGTLTGGLLGHG